MVGKAKISSRQEKAPLSLLLQELVGWQQRRPALGELHRVRHLVDRLRGGSEHSPGLRKIAQLVKFDRRGQACKLQHCRRGFDEAQQSD
jgi:hypothetical protein